MRSRPSQANDGWERTVAQLADAHGCGDCAACRRAIEQAGVPDLIKRWVPFVRSELALRMARMSQRTGRPFPRLTNDEVVQLLIEEACFERLTVLERLQARAAAARDGVEVNDGQPPVEEPEGLRKAREFARNGVAA